MKQIFFVISIVIGLSALTSVAEAKYFLGLTGSRMHLDYKEVTTNGVTAETTGPIELDGITGGINNISLSSYGYELSLGFLGTNSEKLTPKPDWGTTFYYRVAAKGNYTFSWGLFFYIGTDTLVSFYQDAESHYLGIGFLYGVGYRINEHANITLENSNSSILFAGDKFRTLRGQYLSAVYVF